jgi:8-oxo-dGTP pyrophosphatase MutT (NUDIX family)
VGWLPPEQYVKTIENAAAFGCFFFTDTSDRALCLRSRSDPGYWGWPGGNVEPGEHPHQSAVRECTEETGLDLTTLRPELLQTPRLLAVLFARPSTHWPMAKAGYIFDGGELNSQQLADISLDPDEHSEWQVHTLTEWRTLMRPPDHALLQQVHQARASGVTTYVNA